MPAKLRQLLVLCLSGVVALVAATAAWGFLASLQPVAPMSATRMLAIVGPSSSSVGEPLALTLSGAEPSLSEATVVVTSTAGTTSFDISLQQGETAFELAPAFTRSAGVTTVWVIAGRDEALFETQFVAEAAASPIVPLVGPKSIVADGADHAMVVVLPEDPFGNLAADAPSTELSVRRPQGGVIRQPTEVVGLVTWQRVFSGTSAGRSEIAAVTGDSYGPTADLDEVAGEPMPFALIAAPGPLQADGRSLHFVQTEQLVDRFGNLVADGTAVVVRCDEPNGKRQATVVTIDGRATLYVEAPAVPGTMRVQAYASGVSSRILSLEFEAAVDELPVLVRSTEGGWAVEIGPIRTVDAGFVPDGTVAVITDGDIEREVTLVGGRATLVLGAPPTTDAEIEVLGVFRKVNS